LRAAGFLAAGFAFVDFLAVNFGAASFGFGATVFGAATFFAAVFFTVVFSETVFEAAGFFVPVFARTPALTGAAFATGFLLLAEEGLAFGLPGDLRALAASDCVVNSASAMKASFLLEAYP
jgi:hypothetical protein